MAYQGHCQQSIGGDERAFAMRSGILLALLLVTGNAWGGNLYNVTDLGVLSGGTQSKALAINNKGQVVGYSDTSGEDHAFLYGGGTMQDLGVLAGDIWSQAYAINDSGIVVGSSWSSTPDYPHAFIYGGGSLQDIGVKGLANGINNSKQIVGDWQIQGNGFLSSGGSLTNLGRFPGNSYGNAKAINNAGLIVGGSGPADSSWWHAAEYAGTTPQDLGVLGGGTHSEALAVNDLGQIVG
jgi:probable HAF family extracellular repeat protein